MKNKSSKSKKEIKTKNDCTQRSGGNRINNTKITINKVCFL
jgi:hypothetical protein